VRQSLGGHFDFPVLFGKQFETLISALYHNGGDDSSIVNIFYDFA
jgi:hypothetical protein